VRKPIPDQRMSFPRRRYPIPIGSKAIPRDDNKIPDSANAIPDYDTAIPLNGTAGRVKSLLSASGTAKESLRARHPPRQVTELSRQIRHAETAPGEQVEIPAFLRKKW